VRNLRVLVGQRRRLCTAWHPRQNRGATRRHLCGMTAFLVLLLILSRAASGQWNIGLTNSMLGAPSASSPPHYYGLLVSFFVPALSSLSPGEANCSASMGRVVSLHDAIAALNESPYPGVAIPLVSQVDTCPLNYSEFKPAIIDIKATLKSGKTVWPWIFFNRLIGYDNKNGNSHAGVTPAPYYQHIKGMDVTGQTQALHDFYDAFRYSLRAAKELNSPGIVVDVEAYNNYKAQGLPALSKFTGLSQDSLQQRLQNIGSNMVGIAKEEYPNAVIWFLWDGLTTEYIHSFKNARYRAQTYIVLGMLKAAKGQNLPLRIISGGETNGYCYPSLRSLRTTIIQRKRSYAPLLRQYPNLYLGGTLTLWLNPHSRKGWLLTKDCGGAGGLGAHQLMGMIDELERSYDYVWIYANSASDYNPYSQSDASKMNPLLKNVF
jgi:hypothetical protein